MKYVVFGLLLSTLSGAGAQTINAASCSSAAVQTAFNAVTASTTSVTIPAGSCAWTTQVTLTVPSGNTTLSIQGAGSLSATGGGDVTVITDNYPSSNPILAITTTSTGALLRISGISFEGGNPSGNVKYNGMVALNGNSTQIRVDHSHFDSATYTGSSGNSHIQWNGCTSGVMDHNIFDAPAGSVDNEIRDYNQGTCYSDAVGVGDQSWYHATAFGTGSGYVYAENNTFNNGVANDCTVGGKAVFRYNSFNQNGGQLGVQTHPTGGAGRWRGCRAMEVYQNTFTAASGSYVNAAIWLSSGTELVWGNTVPSSSSGGGTGYKNFIELLDMRVNNTTYAQAATPGSWGYCGKAFNGTGSNWDQNSNASTGYRCMDQPGSGIGDLLNGGFTSDGSGSNNVTNVTTGCTASASCAWVNDALEPIYEWMDSYSAVPDNPSNLLSVAEGTFTNNTDYYLWCNASSLSGCTSFTGATGTGSGVLASRPSTCTAGVAYWATDQGNWNQSGSGGQGELFVCTTTNTWTVYYTPYIYPHPLDTKGSTPTPAPAVELQGTVTPG
jgi:hypothetical protein